MKTKNVIKPIPKPVAQIGHWCLKRWNGISGKDYRRFKQIRRELDIAQDRETELNRALAETQARCDALEKALSDRNRELANSYQAFNQRQQDLNQNQKELADSKKLCDDLLQELDQWITDSENQIQSLSQALADQTSALTNCESNLAAIHRTYSQTLAVSVPENTTTITLEAWKIAFVGGHEATRRAVIQTLRTDYGLHNTPVEIPSHKEVSTSQKQLQQKLADCDLIISIVRYSNHSLTKSLKQLKEKGALKGTILVTNSRGATGVVREILSFVEQHPDWLNDAAG